MRWPLLSLLVCACPQEADPETRSCGCELSSDDIWISTGTGLRARAWRAVEPFRPTLLLERISHEKLALPLLASPAHLRAARLAFVLRRLDGPRLATPFSFLDYAAVPTPAACAPARSRSLHPPLRCRSSPHRPCAATASRFSIPPLATSPTARAVPVRLVSRALVDGG